MVAGRATAADVPPALAARQLSVPGVSARERTAPARHAVAAGRPRGGRASANGYLEVAFSDGHASDFAADWLRAFADGAGGAAGASGARSSRTICRSLATPTSLRAARRCGAGSPPSTSSASRSSPAADRAGTVTRVAELFGFVRETNYGRLFDVKTVVNPTNLAYTGLGLGAHTDNPYREPTPTLQLLHASRRVRRAARTRSWTRSASRATFRTTTSSSSRDADPLPICRRRHRARSGVARSLRRRARHVHGSTTTPGRRSRSGSRRTSSPVLRGVPAIRRLLESPDYRIQFKLGPGDLFIVDNLRVLHGRTGYAASGGERHLHHRLPTLQPRVEPAWARTPAGAMTAWRGPGSMTATSEGPWAGCRFFSRRRASARCATEAARAASSRVANPRKLTLVPSTSTDLLFVLQQPEGRFAANTSVLASLPPRTGARATRRPRRVTTRTSTISQLVTNSIRVQMKSSEETLKPPSSGHGRLRAAIPRSWLRRFCPRTASSPTDPPSSGSTCRRCRAPGRRKRSGRSRSPGR